MIQPCQPLVLATEVNRPAEALGTRESGLNPIACTEVVSPTEPCTGPCTEAVISVDFATDAPDTPVLTIQEELQSLVQVCTEPLPDAIMNTHCRVQWAANPDVSTFATCKQSVTDLVRAEGLLVQSELRIAITDIHLRAVKSDQILIPGTIVIFWSLPTLLNCRDMVGTHLAQMASNCLPVTQSVEGESRPLPIMPGGPTVPGPLQGESKPLPKLPSGPDVLGPTGECGLLPRVPKVQDIDCDEPMNDDEVRPPTEPDVLDMQAMAYADVSPTYPWIEPAVAAEDVDMSIPMSSCYPAGPLLKLHEQQFLNLQCPFFDDIKQYAAIQSQKMTVHDRMIILGHQKSICADDDIRFHIQQLTAEYNTKAQANDLRPALMIDPLLFTAWIFGMTRTCPLWTKDNPSSLQDGTIIVSAAAIEGHWIPLYMTHQKEQLYGFTWDTSKKFEHRLEATLQMLSTCLGCRHATNSIHVRGNWETSFCGAFAIAFLRSSMLGEASVSSHEMILELHARLRDAFRSTVTGLLHCPKPWMWGNGSRDKTAQLLCQLLETKGVPLIRFNPDPMQRSKSLDLLRLMRPFARRIPGNSSKWLVRKAASSSCFPPS